MQPRAVLFSVLLIGLSLSAVRVSGQSGVLRWNGPAAGTHVWDTTATNWLDSGETVVSWQTGADAQFDGAGETVDVTAAISVSNLVFLSGGYDISGTGVLAVAGTLSAAAATENTVSAELRARTGLNKIGAGILLLDNPDAWLTNALAVTEGTLALRDTAIPGAVSVADGSAVTVLPSVTNGLTGFYYDVTPNSASFASLDALKAHVSYYTPALVAVSSAAGGTFDFGSDGSRFPFPYGSGGDRTNYFEAVWCGTITVPSSTYYSFRLTHDDGFILGIDNKVVTNRLANSTTESTVYLDAGDHDMILGFYQGAGGYGLKVEVKSPWDIAYTALPNSWLKPYSSVGSLSGNGSAALSAAGSSLKTAPITTSLLTGELAGPSGSLFTKGGWGTLTLASSPVTSNALAGGVSVQGGTLALATAERIGDASTVRVGGDSALTAAASETLGALAGEGTVILGNNTAVRVVSFAGDDDCGISTNKTYTHLLDFPDNGNPATVNGVEFISAGTSGSTNGYTWSVTGNPPTSVLPDSTNDVSYTGISRLLFDFQYGGTDYTLTLSGLTPAQSYETRIYFRSYGGVNPISPRRLTFSFSTGTTYIGSVLYNPDAQYSRSILSCRYTADASGTLSVRVLIHNSAHTCHMYGLSNEETSPPETPSAAAVTYPRAVQFTDDADSGLSTGKTYTHLLDFPANGYPATVNGVDFIAAGMSGSAFGYGWNTTGTAPTILWNDAPNDSTRTGVDRLLRDFIYGSTDYTLNLTGLAPGRTYETRLYFRSFGNLGLDTPRDITFTFTAGVTLIGSITHDLDTLARTRVECRYTADETGSLAIHVVSPSSSYTCHLYGLSNEEINEPVVLTLNTPAGRTARHTGSITGFGTLVKRGEGTQNLGGNNRLTTPLDVQEGTLILAPGASVTAGASVASGATLTAPDGNVWLGGLAGAGTFDLSGESYYPAPSRLAFTYFTNDLTTGISPSKTYTHLMDFGSRANIAVINGVTFTKVSSQNGSANGYGWSNFPPIAHSGNAPDVTHSVPIDTGAYDLLYDMDYGWSWPGSATMQLTGLTPGKRYEVHLFNRCWGWNGSRTQTITFDPDGEGPISDAVTFNPDALNANYLSYRYTPASTTLDITVQSAYSNQTYHLYGLSNEEAADAVTVDIAADSTFSGLVTGGGAWCKTGAGTLTLTGTNDATGALSVEEGTLCVSNGATATLGPVSVANGAALVGDGRVGGDVTIVSNATLRAGTAGACGTLTVGGDLTLEPGSLFTWRYAAGDAIDTVSVAGTLTFPTNGVIQVTTLTAGLSAPSRALLFASAQPIHGPDSLDGWTVDCGEKAGLAYSADRTKIYFFASRGTILMLR